MDPSLLQWIVIGACVAMIAIRAPHGQRSRAIPVVRSCKGPRETALLTVAWIAFFLPLSWVLTPWLDFAATESHPAAAGAGAALLVWGLWLLHASHRDLGRHWSITLELRERHELVDTGIYRRIRHPMYAGLLLFAVGFLLLIPNLVAGPAYLVAMLLLVAFRVPREEQMMREQFGAAYAAYVARTSRLVPGIW